MSHLRPQAAQPRRRGGELLRPCTLHPCALRRRALRRRALRRRASSAAAGANR